MPDDKILVIFILAVSVILQYASSYIAFRITKSSGQVVPWLLIALAILIMAIRRSETLYHIILDKNVLFTDYQIELYAFTVSILMFIGLYKVHPYLRSLFRSKNELKIVNDKLLEEINSHKQTDKSLQQFKNTLDQTLDCIFMFNPDTLKFEYINEGAVKMMGYTENELLEMTPLDIKPEFDKGSFDELIQPMKEGEKPNIIFRTIHRHKDGHDINVEIVLQLTRQNNKELFVAIVRDISERLKIENEILRLNQELETFIYKASHDLRGPIATSRGLLNLTNSSTRQDELKDIIHLLSKTNEKLNNTLNDLMVIIELKRRIIKPKLVNFNRIIKSILDKEFGGLDNQPIKVKINVSSKTKFHTDVFILKLIIKNLVSNSLQYRNKKIDNPCVFVSIEDTDIGVRLTIEDNGIGISKAQQIKIFDLFYKASIDSIGSGLGLFIVKLSVSRLMGTIELTSEEEKGSRFDIYFPDLKNKESMLIQNTIELTGNLANIN